MILMKFKGKKSEKNQSFVIEIIDKKKQEIFKG